MATPKQKYPTVRISAETHKRIKQMADEDNTSMSDVIDSAVEKLRRERIARKANEVWAEAMKDPELQRTWAEEDAAIEDFFRSPIHEPYEEDGEER
jgi:predicted CopG family antitoxin